MTAAIMGIDLVLPGGYRAMAPLVGRRLTLGDCTQFAPPTLVRWEELHWVNGSRRLAVYADERGPILSRRDDISSAVDALRDEEHLIREVAWVFGGELRETGLRGAMCWAIIAGHGTSRHGSTYGATPAKALALYRAQLALNTLADSARALAGDGAGQFNGQAAPETVSVSCTACDIAFPVVAPEEGKPINRTYESCMRKGVSASWDVAPAPSARFHTWEESLRQLGYVSELESVRHGVDHIERIDTAMKHLVLAKEALLAEGRLGGEGRSGKYGADKAWMGAEFELQQAAKALGWKR